MPAQRIHSLTLLRFWASAFVLVHHCLGIFPHFPITIAIGKMGYLGVTFFFVLSGYVLYWSTDRSGSYLSFVWRRLSRIYPLHAIGTSICIAAYLFAGVRLAGYAGTSWGTAANFLLVHAWPTTYLPEIRQAWNGVSWTLSCEFAFYLLAPPLFFLISRNSTERLVRAALMFWLAACALLLWAHNRGYEAILTVAWWTPWGHIFDFFSGALAAKIALERKYRVSLLYSLLLFSVPLGEYCCFVRFENRTDSLASYLLVPGTALVLIAFTDLEREHKLRFTGKGVFVLLGNSSYALYVFHAIALGALPYIFPSVFKISSPTAGEIMTVAFLGCCVVGSCIIYLLIERPLRRLLLRIGSHANDQTSTLN